MKWTPVYFKSMQSLALELTVRYTLFTDKSTDIHWNAAGMWPLGSVHIIFFFISKLPYFIFVFLYFHCTPFLRLCQKSLAKKTRVSEGSFFQAVGPAQPLKRHDIFIPMRLWSARKRFTYSVADRRFPLPVTPEVGQQSFHKCAGAFPNWENPQ